LAFKRTYKEREIKKMNIGILLLYPIINVIVTGLFAGVVTRQYLQRHRAYQFFWAIALGMAFFGSLAYVVMILVHPASDIGVLFFRIYYILGAALIAAWLGLGSIALVASVRMTRICLAVLSVPSVLAVILIAFTNVDRQQLSQIAGTPGTGILQPGTGPWLITIIILNTLGVVAVVGVAFYSAWQVQRRQGSGSLLRANILIIAGALIIALAGTTARLGVKNVFWLIMALGWIVFFIGVLLASRARHPATSPTQKGQEKNKEALQSTT
jgi:MFS family permease